MKVAQAEAHVISSQGLEEKQVFKIRTNAHAFRLLSSGLYSDKPAAVLREIGCNAHDAHIAAKCADRPFDVKLPNQIDSLFYIKDYGTGLSHEEVMNLYTTYFASTKQDSNDFTGAFGLGSKSPFSYTDSFTITSRHGGVSRVYSAHIGNDGSPNIAKMGEAPCSQDTGITISFPVKPEDFGVFRDRAQATYQYFSPCPNVIGGGKINPMEYDNDFGTYAFTKYGGGIKVKMGNVCYPIDLSKLNIQASGSGLINNLSKLDRVLLRFNIGDVQVAASREELQYDPASQAFIRAALMVVIKNMMLELEKVYKTALAENTLLNRIAFQKLVSSTSRGFWIDDKLLKEAGIVDYAEMYKAMRSSNETLPQELQGSRMDMVTKDGNNRFRYASSGDYIHYCDDMTYINIVYGTESHARERVRMAVRAGELKLPVILVTNHKKDKGTNRDVAAMVDVLVRQFGKLPKTPLADLPAPAVVKRVKGKNGLKLLPGDMLAIQPSVYVNQQKFGSWGRSRTYWDIGSEIILEEREIDQFNRNITLLKGVVDIPLFAKLRKIDMIKYQINKRPEWIGLRMHMEKFLSDPKNIAALKAAVGKFKFKLELKMIRYDQDVGLLENLVFILDHKKDIYQAIKPVLVKHNLHDTIVEVRDNSLTQAGVKPLVLVAAYKDLGSLMKIKIDVPEFDAPMVLVNKMFPHAAGLPYRVFTDLWQHAPDRLPEVLDQLLKKG